MFNNILEISKRSTKNGRVPIKIALLKIHDAIEDTNKNGLHWKREYVENAMDSVIGMPLCAEFSDEEKEVPLGHGLTGQVINSDGLPEPIFENSEVVGTCDGVSIETIQDADGNDIDVLMGSGYLYSQRYPKFVKWVRKNYALGEVSTSIEIMGTPENGNKIVFEEDELSDKYRTPMEFLFSGDAILSISPAEDDAIVVEVAEKKINKEDETKMEGFNMEEIKASIKEVISEMNDKSQSYETTISELNEKIEAKDVELSEKETKISELNASVEQIQAALTKLENDQKTWWEEREVLVKELAKAKVAEKLNEVDEALGEFNEEEKEVAKDDIDKLKENINSCEKVEELNDVTSEINSIKSKICMNIVAVQKKAEAEERIAEQNAKNEEKVDVEDIFSEMCMETPKDEEDEDINIF